MATKTAIFAGGCFWGLEELVRALPGVITTQVGYTGGANQDPDNENHPGHAEAVEISYDPEAISYKQLLDFFFRVHDPTTLNRQGNDIGESYRSAIFYSTEDEKSEAQELIDRVNASGYWKKPVVTSLEPFTTFYPAEEYHQDFLQKNPGGYTCHRIRRESYL